MYEKTESLPMSLYSASDGKLVGFVELSKLAYPLTVRVYLDGKEIIPVAFNNFGHPIFSEEQAKIYLLKNFEYKKASKTDEELELKVSYRVDLSYMSRYLFDTAEGIERSLVGLREFNNLLSARMRYVKRRPNERLNSFVVLGKFWLDDRAQVWSIDTSLRGKVVTKKQVESMDEFRRNNPEGCKFIFGTTHLAIPKSNSVCPCCGKQLTIYDVKDNYCVCVDGKYYHESCYHELRKCNEIADIIINLVGCAYQNDEYQYELLPNGYCNDLCCAHIPWFLVHTKYGDIVIGKRKRVISIEWQANFKPFDMNRLFEDEDVTKWTEEGKRGIHAWTNNKALIYLMKVKDALEGGVTE